MKLREAPLHSVPSLDVGKMRKLRLISYWKWLIQKKSTLGAIGFSIFFAAFSWPMLALFENPQGFDPEEVLSNGIELDGIVVGIGENANLTINGRHPAIVRFEFETDGIKRKADHQTMDFLGVSELEVGSKVNLKFYEGNSILLGIDPYEFPFGMFNVFYIVPLVIFAISALILTFHLKGKVPIYKEGIVTDGEIVSLEPLYHYKKIAFRSLSKNHHRIFYTFKDRIGKQHTGTEVTTDKLLTQESKKGDRLKIVFLDSNPEKNCIFEDYLTK